MRLGIATFALLLFVTACGSDDDSGEPNDAAEESSTPSETVTEEPTATPEQLASIIAGQVKDWREVIDTAGDCRFTWTLGETPLEEAEGFSCYLREMTIGYTAKTAVRELSALTPPDSMTSLVTETIAALQSIVDVDLEAVCGKIDGPKDTRACDLTLGQRYSAYSDLENALDMWRPYL